MFLRTFTIFLSCCLTSSNLIAQEDVSIKATVKSLDNNAPLPYCFVKLKNLPIGTITNEDGVFELNLKSTSLKDTLLISSIGYETYKQTCADIIQNNTIFLKTNYYSLPEVSITPEPTVENILENVYNSYKKNFLDNTVQISGFFRSYFKSDNVYDKLIEGDISMISKGFNKNKNIWNKHFIYLNETRASLNSGKIKEGKGVNNFNEIIVIYETYLNQLKQDKLFNSKIRIDKVEYEGEKKVYDLIFKNRNEEKFSETTISLKINSTNWAIEQLEYNSSFYKADDAQIKQSNIDSIRFRSVSDNFMIQYININGKYYLNFFKRKYKKEIFSPTNNYEFIISTEYLTNQINLGKGPIGTPLIRTESLYEQVCKLPYHQDFWKGYNLLLENSELIKIKKDLELKGNIDDQFNNANKYQKGNKKSKK